MQTDDKNLIELYQDYIDDEGYVQRYNYDKGRYYNTGTCLKGPKGNPGNPGRSGKDGLTPRINQDNGHWMIGDVDTGVTAGGTGGQLKTINGESLQGTGDITTKSYHTFKDNWINAGSIQNLCQAIVTDPQVEAGLSYYGKFQGSGLPAGIGQAEMTIDVIADDQSNGRSLVLTVYSADTAPYKWEAQYVKINGNYPSFSSDPSVTYKFIWRSYQQQITSTNKLDYSLIQNAPTIPNPQIQSDWNQSNSSSKDYIKNKPTIPQIWRGTQAEYDLIDTPDDNITS